MTLQSIAPNRNATSLPSSCVEPVLYAVVNDTSARRSLESASASAGWWAVMFTSAAEMLDHPCKHGVSCLVLDADAPNDDPLALQRRLKLRHPTMPIIFITGRADVRMAVKAMRAGAVDVLMRPFSREHMQDTVRHAFLRSDEMLKEASELRGLVARYTDLTPREKEVMALIAAGLMNKQVGGHLGISEITVKAHRSKVMQKMQARSFADLVLMAWKLGANSPRAAPQITLQVEAQQPPQALFVNCYVKSASFSDSELRQGNV